MLSRDAIQRHRENLYHDLNTALHNRVNKTSDEDTYGLSALAQEMRILLNNIERNAPRRRKRARPKVVSG